jgi:hypothetical protein
MKKIFLALVIPLTIFSCQKEGLYSGDKMDAAGSSGGSGQSQDSTLEPGQITAGEWNDLENWFMWDTLIHGQTYSKMSDYWDLNTDARITVSLENSTGEMLSDVVVELLDADKDVIWSARTDNLGITELWFKPFSGAKGYSFNDLSVKVLGKIYETKDSFSEGVLNITNIEEPQYNSLSADLGFMVDATGSMADELEFLKVELMDVIEKVQALNPNVSLRTGSVFYRDEGDQYVTRKSEFSDRISKTVNFIKDQKADGGGDFPEAVHTALDVSLNELEWSDQATARLLFMVLDAPPHHEDQIIGSLHNRISEAAEMGIKLIPIVASGIDKETEFLMRYMAILTNGTYVFITNDSGIGNDHLAPTVGDYEVEMLNDLMVRLISESLN